MSWLGAVARLFFGSGLGGHGHRGGFGALGGHGGHHGGGHGSHEEHSNDARPANAPDAAIDAVGGEAVATARALSSVYEGKIYYFASKENRERFEAAPQDYAHKVAGHVVRSAEPAYERPRRRGGC